MIPILILKLVSLKILSKTQNRIAVITQKGLEEQEKWKGLANYMKEDNVSIIFGKRVWDVNRETVTFAYSIYLNITNGEITLRSEENSSI